MKEINFPLSLVTSGQRVVLVGYKGNGRSNQRLAELGLTPETEIRVLQAIPGQPIVLCTRGYKLAIDRRTAAQIQVKLSKDAEEFPCSRRTRRRRLGRGIFRPRWRQIRRPLVELRWQLSDILKQAADEER
jgi:Fe2+ transport system protein FeoA